MRDTVDGLKPRICARLDWVISRSAEARRTALVRMRRGSGLELLSGRGMRSMPVEIKSYTAFYRNIVNPAKPRTRIAAGCRIAGYLAPTEALPMKVVAAGSGCLLFSLMFRRSSFCESALRI